MRLILRTSFAMMVVLLLLLEVQISSAYVPSRQARFITFSNVQATTMTIDWVRGNGDGVLVLMREGEYPPVVTSLGNDYTLLQSEDADFSAAFEEGSTSAKLVGKGNISTLDVTGLDPDTKYQVMVVEYNVDGSYLDVQNATAAFNPRWKKTFPQPLGPPTDISTTAQTATTATITWTDDPNAVGYYLDVQLDKDFWNDPYGDPTGPTEYDLLDIGEIGPDVYLITGLPVASTVGSMYRFRMRSYDALGNISVASAWVYFDSECSDPIVDTEDEGQLRSASTCGLTFSLSASIVTGECGTPSSTGTWTVIDKPIGSGTPSFNTDVYDETPDVTVDTYGTYVFEFTISVGAYYSSDTYTVTFDESPTIPNAGSDASYCGLTYTLEGTTLSGSQTGSWSYLSGPGSTTFGTPTSPTSTATVDAYGTFTFQWTVVNGSCTSTDFVDITYLSGVTTSSAGEDGSQCGLTGYTLSGNTPSAGTGSWVQYSGPGTASFSAPTSPTSNVSVDIQGTYILQWIISNGTCSSTDDVSVIFYSTPTTSSVTTASESTCGYSLALDGNTPSVGTGTWTLGVGPEGGTYSFDPDANTPTATVTVDRQGSWSFTWSIGNGTCTPSSSTKNILFYGDATTADAGEAGSACGLSYTLQGNTPTVGTGSWTQISGSGTASFATPTTPGAIATIPTYEGNSDSYTFRWTISNSTCTGSYDDVVITYYKTPTTASVTDVNETFCDLTGTLDGNTPLVGTGLWTSSPPPSAAGPGPGTGTVSFTDPTDPTTGVSVTSQGIYHFTWTITNGTCTSSIVKTVTFYTTPTTASAGENNSACGTSYVLAGNTPQVGTGSWTFISGTGCGTPTFATTTTPNATVSVITPTGSYCTYTFRWTITNGTCSSTDDVDISFYRSPTTATAGADGTNCGTFGYALSGNIPTYGTGSWTKVTGAGTVEFSDATSNTSLAEPSDYGTYTFRWTISNGTCTSSSDDVNVIYYETPTTASAGEDASVCSYSYTLAGNIPNAGTGTWTQLSGPGTATFDDANLGTSGVTVDVLGPYIFVWTIGNGTCSATSDDVAITFNTPISAFAGIDAYGCYDGQGLAGVHTLDANTPSPGTGAWSLISAPAGGTASFGNTTSPNSTVTVNKLGGYTLRWTVTNGSCVLYDDVIITFVKNLVYSGFDGISGSTVVSAGTSGVEYTVPSLEGAISYSWTYTPAFDVTIQGSGTNSYTTNNIIKIDYGMNATTGTGGILTLIPNGLCGPGTPLYLPITVNNNPVILSGTMDKVTPNGSVTIVTNTPVYTANACAGALTASDFQLTFVKGSGTATGYTIGTVTNPSLDNKTWVLQLVINALSPKPNGCETIEIKAVANEIWSCVPAAMANTETSGILSLYNENEPDDPSDFSVAVPSIINVYASQLTYNWTNGSGNKRIVVATTNASVTAPTDFTNYTANSQYGLGSTTATNNYVVYNGNGNSVTITGLAANTTYIFKVFEYNQACGTANYMTTGTTSTATTEPTATKLVITAATKPTLVKSGEVWTVFTVQAQDAAGNLRYPMCNETVTLTDNNGGTWSGNSGTLSATSTSMSLSTVKYLKAAGALATTFTVDDDACGNNLTADAFTVNVRPDEPTTHATKIYFTMGDQDSIGLYWNIGSGNGRALIVKRVVSSDKVPSTILTDGDNLSTVKNHTYLYKADSLTRDTKKITYLNGLLTDSAFVIFRTYNTTNLTDSARVKGLEPGTAYSFRITEFAHAPSGAAVWETYNYKNATAGEYQNPRTKSTSAKFGSFSGIEISDFYGRSYDAKAELNWEAISEDGLTGYEIYRMNPELGDEFVKVGNVDVKTAIGGSNVYKLIDSDNSLEVGKEYFYRLVGVGFDGQHYELSEVALTILTMPDNDISLFVSEVNPNPVKDVVRFNVQTVKSAPVVIEIRNSIGQVIFTEERTINGVQNFEYNMNTKAAGKYFITVSSGQDAVLSPFVYVP